MQSTRLTNEVLRERCRRHYVHEPYPSPPSLPSAVMARLTKRPWGPTESDVECLYMRNLERLLSEKEEEKEEKEEEMNHLTRLHLLLEYAQHTQYMVCALAFRNELYHFTAKRSLILFAIFEGALGPDVPLFENMEEEEEEDEHEWTHFRFLGDDDVAHIQELVLAPRESNEQTHVADFLRDWVSADKERAARFALFSRSPSSQCTLSEALVEMSHKK